MPFPISTASCSPAARLMEVLSGWAFELSEGHSLDIWMDVRASAADGQ